MLFLENGGGKSVLIKLIFSVMLPGRRQVVGTTNTKVLEKFVLARDVAHVVLEWMHTQTGRLLITGKVSEWRDRRISTDADNLLDSWYSLRPGHRVDLDTLPFAEDGLKLSVAEFKTRLAAVNADDPTVDLYWTRTHGLWTEQLDAVGLDTELFRYQRAMNAGEGEAADAFTFASDEAFVEFLLRAVLPEDGPNEVADVLATYADTLSSRSDLMLEKEFVGSVLAFLVPLAERQHAAIKARNHADSAVKALQELAAMVASRTRRQTELLAQRQKHVAEIEAQEKATAAALASQKDVHAELKLRVAQLRLADALARQKTATDAASEASLTAQAWSATGTVLKQMQAEDRVQGLEKLVHAREDAARPALEQRNAAARALARGLMSIARSADEEALLKREQAADRTTRADEIQGQRDEAATSAAQAAARAEQLDERIAEVRQEIVAATRDGLLLEGTPAAEAAASLKERAKREGAALARQEQRLRDLDAEQQEAQVELDSAKQALTGAQQRLNEASGAVRRATERTDALAAVPRLVDLLDTDDVRLDVDTPALLRLLAEAQSRTDQARTRLRVAEASDEQARLALDAGDLLPPPTDVMQIHETLRNAGITCWTGWEYLTEIPTVHAREAVVRRLPHLAGGVLLNDPQDLDLARRLVAEAGLRPTAVVAVAATHALAQPEPDAGNPATREVFVVPPHSALYNPEAAEAERLTITARHTRRLMELEGLDARLATDRELATRLMAWREDYPPGSIAALEQQAHGCERQVEEAAEVVDQRATVVLKFTQSRAELRDALPELRAALSDLERDSNRLSTLAERERQITTWSREASNARNIQAEDSKRAEGLQRHCAELRREAADLQREADQHESTAVRARADLADIRGAAQVSEDDPIPEAAIPVLRERLQEAERTYSQAEVGADLRSALDQAHRAEAQANAALRELGEGVAIRAGELLSSPSGSDPASRAAARERAEANALKAETQRAAAVGTVTAEQTLLDALPQPARPVHLPETPRDVAQGERLLNVAATSIDKVIADHEDLTRQRGEAVQAMEEIRQIANAFQILNATTAPHAQDGEVNTADAFDGDVDTARERYTRLHAAWQKADIEARHAEDDLRSAADDVAQCAADRKFETLNAPVRTQIVAIHRNTLPDHATTWIEALRPRLRSLVDDLDQIDRHRKAIVVRLQALVEDALRTLRQAQRLSRLPRGLSDWSEKEFLRIAFTPLEGAVLAERVGEVIDEAAPGAGRAAKRDGITLLLRGVMAAVPKGFHVDLLKPDAVLRDERERVSEITDVFSGGQQLTAAIIVYCTMAGLRANDRGRPRLRHSGVLFLDNPIGRASAGYLLDLQRGVAAALGVQLIYTTGLFDAEALSNFPVIVGLRNDADLRAGRKYLSVEHTVRPHLNGLAPPDGTGVLSSTRVLLRDTNRYDQPAPPRP
ncbi:hypothetical protein [Micromonospora sp. NPDC047730]|uniref:hypothetical protein n=1 Tax=Micromonospora sp. NPDC047730 TaxID=3364253 RepID=UPI00371F0EC7